MQNTLTLPNFFDIYILLASYVKKLLLFYPPPSPPLVLVTRLTSIIFSKESEKIWITFPEFLIKREQREHWELRLSPVAVLSRETYELFVFLSPLSLSLPRLFCFSRSLTLSFCCPLCCFRYPFSPFSLLLLSQRFFEVPFKLLLFSRLGVFAPEFEHSYREGVLHLCLFGSCVSSFLHVCRLFTCL